HRWGGAAGEGAGLDDLSRVQDLGEVGGRQTQREGGRMFPRGRIEPFAVEVDATQPFAAGATYGDAHDLIGGAVVDLAGLHDVFGQVGRLAEARLERAPHLLLVHRQGA